jgi:hypothetical protein
MFLFRARLKVMKWRSQVCWYRFNSRDMGESAQRHVASLAKTVRAERECPHFKIEIWSKLNVGHPDLKIETWGTRGSIFDER